MKLVHEVLLTSAENEEVFCFPILQFQKCSRYYQAGRTAVTAKPVQFVSNELSLLSYCQCCFSVTLSCIIGEDLNWLTGRFRLLIGFPGAQHRYYVIPCTRVPLNVEDANPV